MSKILTFVKHPVVSIKCKISDYKQNKIKYYLKPENFEKLSDKKAIKVRYYLNFGKYPNLKHPKTFNEKLQWLKLYNRKPEYTKLVDKYEVKKIVADIIGEEYIIPTLGVWNSADEIDFDSLPDKFVLKCTHDSASVIICKDKSKFDVTDAKERLDACLKKNLYIWGREWPYKDVKPRIIAEEFLDDASGNLNDYKFFCFNGYVDCVMVCLDRQVNNTKYYFFDNQWNLKRINILGKKASQNFSLPKPFKIDQMFDIARTLSKGIPFIRVDLYFTNEKIYFGELTFFPSCGYDANLLPETDKYFGELIKISRRDKY